MTIPFVDILIDNAPDIPDVLEKGTDAVVHWLADAAEDTLASFVPAYGIARGQGLIICAALPNMDANKCQHELDSIKYTLFDDFARVTGLRSIIAGIVAAWHLIPAPIRLLAQAGGEAAKEARRILGQGKALLASLANFDPVKTMQLIGQTPTLLLSAGYNLFNTGLGTVESLATMFVDVADTLKDKLPNIPILKDLLTGVIDVAAVPMAVLGKAATAAKWLLGKAFAVGSITAQFFAQAVAYLAHRFGEAAEDVVSGILDTGEGIGHVVDELFSGGIEVNFGLGGPSAAEREASRAKWYAQERAILDFYGSEDNIPADNIYWRVRTARDGVEQSRIQMQNYQTTGQLLTLPTWHDIVQQQQAYA